MSESATTFVVADPASHGVSAVRLIVMKVIYGGTFLFVGVDAWKTILTHSGPWDPMQGVAWSFWAAYGTVMVLGLRYPMKFLPLLLLQVLYKLVWLAGVGYPLWSTGHLMDSSVKPEMLPASQLAAVFVLAVVIDVAVIPWRYVLRNYVLKGAGD
jgi:hypothetical protein